MKYPKAKYNIGDKVVVDEFEDATIAKRGLFKKKSTGEISWNYQLKDNLLPGFWAEENRIKIK